jgi:LmbE family N-acetylglucosaminyl deacetylase
VISPHLDDAVFGCGVWLATRPGSRVATVFAGVPSDPALATAWDRRCGFASAGEAVTMRLDEDRRALARVGAEPTWLDFADAQYGRTPAREAIADALRRLLETERPHWLLLPLGLFHSDHRLVHEAAVEAFGPRSDGVDLVFWEDALYRAMPGVLQARLAELLAAGQVGTPLFDVPPTPAAWGAKRKAVAAYSSQLRAFGPGGAEDVERPERFWRFGPAGAAA